MKRIALKEVEQFKKIAGLVNENWHPDKDWDEEDDQEDTGEDYPSDEDLFGMREYFDKDALDKQARDIDTHIQYSFSADFDDSNLEGDQKKYLQKLAWVLRQKGASDPEIKNILKKSYLVGKRGQTKSYYDLYQDVKKWSRKQSN